MKIIPILLISGCLAGAPNTLSPAEKSAGWRLLFDGKSLAGWDDPSRKSPPGDSWVVEEGCIKAVRNPRIREDLVTLESFGDFELAFEWRISARGNSGVKYRIQDRLRLPEAGDDRRRFEERVNEELRLRRHLREKMEPGMKYQEYLIGFEYQVIDNQGHPDVAHGADRSTGAIYSMVAPTTQAARPVGEFNESRIVLRGNRVEHWLNGVKVVDTDLGVPAIAEGLAKRWTTASPVYQMLTRQPKKRTPIALQHHIDEVWFRNLKIRPLAATSAAPAAAQSPRMTVYKTTTCGCCAIWVEHVKKHGISATVVDVPSTAEYQRKYGVPGQLLSCHTAVVAGYTIEGHVPAPDLLRLLKQRPKAQGLAVPGMPLGSPGMEAERRQAYSVLLFQADGQVSVFNKYPGD